MPSPATTSSSSQPSPMSARRSSSYAPAVDLDYRLTFKLMTMRRLRRQMGGTIDNRSSRAFAVILAFACIAFGIVDIAFKTSTGANQTDSAEDSTLYLGFDFNNLKEWNQIFTFALAGLLLIITTWVAAVVRPVIFWVVMGLISYGILTLLEARGQCPKCVDKYSGAVLWSTIGAVLASVALWAVSNVLYPYLLSTGQCCLADVTWWWSVRPCGPHRPSQYVYRPSSASPYLPWTERLNRWLRVPPRFFGYDGALDSEGRPHGLGTWNDSARSGETLYGVWEHGVPTGPFRATEYESGFTFRSLRVAYCQCRAEPLDEYWFRAERHPDGPRWGVVSVECSSAGRFFKHLPEVSPISGPEAAAPLGLKWRDLGAVRDFGGARPAHGKLLAHAALVDALRAKGAGGLAETATFSAEEFAALGVLRLRHHDYVQVGGRYWKPSRPSAAWCIEQLIKLDDPALEGCRHPPTLVVTAGRGGVQISGYHVPVGADKSRVVIEFVAAHADDDADEDASLSAPTAGSVSGADAGAANDGAADDAACGAAPASAPAAEAIAAVAAVALADDAADLADLAGGVGGEVSALAVPAPTTRLTGSATTTAALRRASSGCVASERLSSGERSGESRSRQRVSPGLLGVHGAAARGAAVARGAAGCGAAAAAIEAEEWARADVSRAELSGYFEGDAAAGVLTAARLTELSELEAATEHPDEAWYLGNTPQAGLSVRGGDGRRWRLTSESGNYEAVVFLHGFNSPTSDALKRIAQLWTLGEFPTHLHPFVFGWPGGQTVGYFQAKRMAQDEPAMAQDFADFIESLGEAGCRQVHIIAHSMGAMLLFAALPLLANLLEAAPVGDAHAPRGGPPLSPSPVAGRALPSTAAPAASAKGKPSMRLATTLLMNPDSSLERFLATDFHRLRGLCEHITLYADHADGALAYSEFFNRTRALGKHPFELVHITEKPTTAPREKPAAREEAGARTRDDAACTAAGTAAAGAKAVAVVHIDHCHVEAVPAASASFPPADAYASADASAVEAEATGSVEASNVTVVVDAPPPLADEPPAIGSPHRSAQHASLRRAFTSLRRQLTEPNGSDESSTWQWRRAGRAVRGAAPLAPAGKRMAPLDLDVIDVSWMDNNVHEMRHNFFNLNRWMIDDIREVILTQRRARLRTARMTHRFTNVWSFLAAPRHVVNP